MIGARRPLPASGRADGKRVRWDEALGSEAKTGDVLMENQVQDAACPLFLLQGDTTLRVTDVGPDPLNASPRCGR